MGITAMAKEAFKDGKEIIMPPDELKPKDKERKTERIRLLNRNREPLERGCLWKVEAT